MNPKQPEAYVAGAAGDAIKPYLDAEGKTFARDFFMTDRIAAMAGVTVADYGAVNTAFNSPGGVATGQKPDHLFVVMPGSPGRLPNMMTSSAGTPEAYGGPGWNPYGAIYRYDNHSKPQVNYASWLMAGAPKANDFGEWGEGGLPLAYVQETWKDPRYRDLDQPGWPASRYPGKNGGKW